MTNFLRNWDYKKHAIAVTTLYAGIFAAGNILFRKKRREKLPRTYKRQTIFNCIAATGFALDMSLAYILIKRLGDNRID